MDNISHHQSLEDTIIQSAGEMAESLSINRLVGQIYSLLYINPEPVSLDEMVEKLKISKGSASVNIRNLEDWNAVKKVLVPGSRKDYYTAEPDFLKVVSERLHQGFSKRLRYADEKLKQMNEMVNSQGGNGDKQLKSFYKSRLEKIQEVRDLLDGALKVLPKVRSMGALKIIKTLLNY